VKRYALRASRRKRGDYICRPCEVQKGHKGTDESKMLSGYKHRAALAKVPFDLDESIFPPPPWCPACGQVLERGREDRNTSPSLDRIVPERGYVKSNVAWLCQRCNWIKRDATVPELYALADWLWDQYKRRGIPLPETQNRRILKGSIDETTETEEET
jgi:hypothetical protein